MPERFYNKKYLIIYLLPVFLILLVSLLPLHVKNGQMLFLGIAALIFLLPDYRDSLNRVFLQPWALSALVLLGLFIIACLWGPSDMETRGFVLEKYNKLLLLPIFAVGFREQWIRRTSLYAFLITMAIFCVLSIIQAYQLIPLSLYNINNLFHDHITIGFMTAFAAYLAAALGFEKVYRWRWRLLHFSLTALYSYQVLLINDGRTGYVIYLFLGILFFYQYCTWRQTLVGLPIFLLAFSVAYLHGSVMQQRTNEFINETHNYQRNQDQNSSAGYRLEAYKFTWKLFNQHPWIGNGTGGFKYLSRQDYPTAGSGLLEPHNQYSLALADLGMVGLVALLTVFATLLWSCYHLHEMRSLGIAMILSFMLGNFADSLLYFSGAGYFFITIMALCLGELVPTRSSAKELLIRRAE